jgi:hypothetical protein
VFKNKVLRRIFGPKRDEVRGGWRKLHNGLRSSFSSPSTIRITVQESKMDWACRTNGETRNPYRLMVGNAEGRIPLGRPRSRWVDTIKCILEREARAVWAELIWLKIRTSWGSSEHGSEP